MRVGRNAGRDRIRPSHAPVAPPCHRLRLSGELAGPTCQRVLDRVDRWLTVDGGPVEVEVGTLTYFDLPTLERLAGLMEAAPGRLRVAGLDEAIATLLSVDEEPVPVARRTGAPYARLHQLAVVTPDPDDDLHEALSTAVADGAGTVVVDLVHAPALTPAAAALVIELGADLEAAHRRLLVVNATPVAAALLYRASPAPSTEVVTLPDA